jgi:hypothetical protein
MKTLDIPKSGKCGNIVAYQSRYGSCQRQLVVPANTQSPARQQRRRDFGGFAGAWGRVLTEEQRVAWNVAGPMVQSKTRLGWGPLSGQQLFQGLNSARACIGKKDLLLVPPAPVVFEPNPVGQLIIRNREDGVRLLVKVTGPVTEDIMVFGQAPCSAGRMKRRNLAYLGLLSASHDGLSDITDMYVARYGEPRPGEKVFIVTRQQKDGWEGFDRETNEIVPEKSAEQQAAGTQSVTLFVHMHKGCTKDAQGIGSQAVPERPEGGKGGASPVEARDEAGGSQEQAVAKTFSRVLRPIPAASAPDAVALALTRTGEFRQPD